ncbi:Skb1 methyltransferase family protein [Cryptosporidium serpentis]
MPLKIGLQIFYIGMEVFEPNDYATEFDGIDLTDESLLIKKLYNRLCQIGYDFIVVPISKAKSETLCKVDTQSPFSWIPRHQNHKLLESNIWTSKIVGVLPQNLESEVQLESLLGWGAYIGYYALIIDIKALSTCLFTTLSSFMKSNTSNSHIWIRISIHDNNQWNTWNSLKYRVNNGIRRSFLGLILYIYSLCISEEDFLKWERFLGEPVRCIVVNSKLLKNLMDNSEFLHKTKAILNRFLRLRVPIVVGENGYYKSLFLCKKWQAQVAEFINNLPSLTQQEVFEYGYTDVLQTPLQPLYSNLQSAFYEIFEKDQVKYNKYQEAIKTFLIDFYNKKNTSTKVSIMVVGGGRGPLIQCSINALKDLNLEYSQLICVEKNINAVATLLGRVQYDPDPVWKNVKIINSDIRNLKSQIKVDLIVSELLGSFGDNELSPECLDAAQEFLKHDGIMIPESYYSAVEPISSYKLWFNISTQDIPHGLEIPYVVRVKSAFHISCQGPQKVFEFHHPNKQLARQSQFNKHNKRYSKILFTAKEDSTIHGFLGYFYCSLYKDICLSTIPHTHTLNLVSWFEYLLPLLKPINIQKNESFIFHIWRKFSDNKVWYEWTVKYREIALIHNLNSKAFHLSL